ncbi:polysaccharide deacetylase family protein, partial [Candidatus Omnitrophota bacterium]
ITEMVGKEGFLSWKEIEEMSASGIITIGSHTKTQCWLPDQGDSDLKEELSGSKDILEKRLKKAVGLISYPIGAHDERVKIAASLAGYKAAVATNPGKEKPRDDVFAIKRQRISNSSDSLFVFWVESSGFYTFIKEHRDD